MGLVFALEETKPLAGEGSVEMGHLLSHRGEAAPPLLSLLPTLLLLTRLPSPSFPQ